MKIRNVENYSYSCLH